MSLTEKILALKKEKNAIILAHYYTLPEVQEIADFVGDSLALSRKAAHTDANIILFAGVHFMAETAKMLNPNKKVLIPNLAAGCSLADSCSYDAFLAFIKDYPQHTIISYINCSAKIKMLSDIIVTSGNALKIVSNLPQDEKIIFAPDKNLGAYINHATHRNMILWDGACHVHDRLDAEVILQLKSQYPDAKVVAHPECKTAVLELADFVGSTAAMLSHIHQELHPQYIIATESGIIHELKKQNPNLSFIPIPNRDNDNCPNCEYMKMNNLTNIYQSLLDEKPELLLSDEAIVLGRKPIEKMMKLS